MGPWSPKVAPHPPYPQCPEIPWLPHWWWSCCDFAFPLSASSGTGSFSVGRCWRVYWPMHWPEHTHRCHSPLCFLFFYYSHMCIQCLGHFSPRAPPPPLPLLPPLPPVTPCYQAETILPLSQVLLKREYKQ
jgi:hypothetical protein